MVAIAELIEDRPANWTDPGDDVQSCFRQCGRSSRQTDTGGVHTDALGWVGAVGRAILKAGPVEL